MGWLTAPWEPVGSGNTCRLEVPGGWLVLTWNDQEVHDTIGVYTRVTAPAICFVPDGNHIWRYSKYDKHGHLVPKDK